MVILQIEQANEFNSLELIESIESKQKRSIVQYRVPFIVHFYQMRCGCGFFSELVSKKYGLLQNQLNFFLSHQLRW